MVNIKTGEFGADMEGVCEELYDLFSDIENAWTDHGWKAPVITSGRRYPQSEELNKPKPSFHFFGEAIDIRSHDLSDDNQDELAHDLQFRVGPFFQVVSEHFNDPTNNHIHVEMDTSVIFPAAKIWYEGKEARKRSNK